MVRYTLAAVCAVLAALVTSAAMGASGTHRKVAANGSDSGDCTKAPCLTIGYAVGQASPGDTIDVATGTYAESVDVTKSLKLVGHDAVIDGTLPNDDYRPNGIVIHGDSAAGTEVRGFTVQNAGREGIWVTQTSNVTIDHNTVVHNDAYGPFSAQCPAADPDDCGEAIHLETVTHSQVSHNLVQDNVGGILLTDEEGPTAWNEIDHNRVLDNSKDCGITLASHFFVLPPGGPADPADGGVYQNTVEHNTSNGNGAAGIGVFAGPPGAAAWGNVVAHNTANDNGLPGIAIHSHFGFQNAEDNVVVDNFVSGNGEDDDAQTGGDTGIIVFADTAGTAGDPPATAIQHSIVSGNHVSNEEYGIYLKGANAPDGLQSNHFAGSVDMPIQGP